MENIPFEIPPNAFSCDICGWSCIQRYDLVRHMIHHTGTLPFTCTVCNQVFALKVNLKAHKSVHLRQYVEVTEYKEGLDVFDTKEGIDTIKEEDFDIGSIADINDPLSVPFNTGVIVQQSKNSLVNITDGVPEEIKLENICDDDRNESQTINNTIESLPEHRKIYENEDDILFQDFELKYSESSNNGAHNVATLQQPNEREVIINDKEDSLDRITEDDLFYHNIGSLDDTLNCNRELFSSMPKNNIEMIGSVCGETVNQDDDMLSDLEIKIEDSLGLEPIDSNSSLIKMNSEKGCNISKQNNKHFIRNILGDKDNSESDNECSFHDKTNENLGNEIHIKKAFNKSHSKEKEKHPCNICKSRFPTIYALVKHEIINHMFCPQCGELFKTIQAFNRHKKYDLDCQKGQHTNIEIEKSFDIEEVNCSNSEKGKSLDDNIEKTLDTNKEQIYVVNNSNSLDTDKTKAVHNNNEKTSVTKKEISSIKTPWQPETNAINDLEALIPVQIIRKYTCDICYQTFLNHDELNQHKMKSDFCDYVITSNARGVNMIPSEVEKIPSEVEQIPSEVEWIPSGVDRISSEVGILPREEELIKFSEEGIKFRIQAETRKQEKEASAQMQRMSYAFSCNECHQLFVNQGGLNLHKSTKIQCNQKARIEAMKICNDSEQIYRYYFDSITHPQHIITIGDNFEFKPKDIPSSRDIPSNGTFKCNFVCSDKNCKAPKLRVDFGSLENYRTGVTPKLVSCPSADEHVIQDASGQLIPHTTKGIERQLLDFKYETDSKQKELLSKGEELSTKEYKRLKDEHATKIQSDSLRHIFTENVIPWYTVVRRKNKLLESNPEFRIQVEKRKKELELENGQCISEISCDVCNKHFASQGALNGHKSTSEQCNLKAKNEAKKILSEKEHIFRYYFENQSASALYMHRIITIGDTYEFRRTNDKPKNPPSNGTYMCKFICSVKTCKAPKLRVDFGSLNNYKTGVTPKLVSCPSADEHVIQDDSGHLIPHTTKGIERQLQDFRFEIGSKQKELLSKGEELSLDEYKRLRDIHASKIQPDSLSQIFTENVIQWESVLVKKNRLLKSNPEFRIQAEKRKLELEDGISVKRQRKRMDLSKKVDDLHDNNDSDGTRTFRFYLKPDLTKIQHIITIGDGHVFSLSNRPKKKNLPKNHYRVSFSCSEKKCLAPSVLVDYGSFDNFKKGCEPKLIYCPEEREHVTGCTQDREHVTGCTQDGEYDYTQVHQPSGVERFLLEADIFVKNKIKGLLKQGKSLKKSEYGELMETKADQINPDLRSRFLESAPSWPAVKRKQGTLKREMNSAIELIKK